MTTPVPKEMQLYSARLATFQTTHQLSKRRKSSSTTRKKKDGAVEWPHKAPSPEQLARAGFFYRPGQDSLDNVQCFFCKVKLDGWEATDDPIQEHLAHSDWCAWATARSVEREEDQTGVSPEERDPLSEPMVTARQATFTHGDGWPHEGKKGWKCKVAKMVEAGWAWDPTADGDESDGVTCFYCNLSLDGWEPKDDPLLEHRRRAPDCVFFNLLDRFHGAAEPIAKSKKPKGTRKGRASSSTTGRASFQSTTSDVPLTTESDALAPADSSLAGMDDSIVTTATNASQSTATGGEQAKKKGGKSKAAKSVSRKKKADTKYTANDEPLISYPELDRPQLTEDLDIADLQDEGSGKVAKKAAARPKKNAARSSKQVNSSTAESDLVDSAPSEKPSRSRKPKTQEQAPPEDDDLADTQPFDMELVANARISNASAQLQDELEQSMDNFSEVQPTDQSTPPAAQTKPKRGVKRTSNGSQKQQSPSAVVTVDNTIAPPDQATTKSKKGRKVKKPSVATNNTKEDSTSGMDQLNQDNATEVETQRPSQLPTDTLKDSEPELQTGPKKSISQTRTKKTSSASNSGSSKAGYAITSSEVFISGPENLERDEMEIQAELEKIEAEQASKAIVEASHVLRDVPMDHPKHFAAPTSQIPRRNTETLDIENGTVHMASPVRQSPHPTAGNGTPSPSGSDKENQPSSIVQPSAKERSQPQIILSPTKTTRVPLASGTPNRTPRRAQISPSKQMSHLSSVAPWTAMDLDMVLVQSPQPTPGRLGQQLIAAAGELTSPEKKMSVEEWVSYRATKGEEEMKRRCEEMVAVFEREGNRGFESLAGIAVVE